MDIAFQLLLITHLLALVVGTATTVAMPVVMGRMAGAGPDGRQMLVGIGNRLSLNARIAFGVLLLSGFAMVFVRYGSVDGMSVWFWVKMGLVVVVLTALILGAVTRPGTLSPRVMGWVTRLALIGIIVSAVFAFN
jgi:putative membrane protein